VTSAKQWVDDLFSLELKDVPHKPSGTINVIVYDKTNVPPPGARTVGDRVKTAFNTHESLTFWWKVGSFLDQAVAFADYTAGAASWDEAFDGVLEAVDRESRKTGKPATIASLQFWGHGSPGTAFMGGDDLGKVSVAPGGEEHPLAAKVAERMHPRQGHVWFRCCSAFQGQRGHDFARRAATTFRVPVVGHTFIIHALQSGTRVLRPEGAPDWELDEGIKKRGREKGKDLVSGPLRVRTVSMFRLYPPMDGGRVVVPPLVLGPLMRGIAKIEDDDA
jgi:hypothetical protein